jgi:hypothetical protein
MRVPLKDLRLRYIALDAVLLLTLLVLALYLPFASGAPAPANAAAPQPANNAMPVNPPQTRPSDMAIRHVDGNTLQSPGQPKIAIHVAKAFKALPVLAFPIRHDTWAERWIFVDAAPDRTIRRLVIVQFEHALDGAGFRFVYPATPPMTWGGAVWRHGAFIGSDASAIAEGPGLEVDRTKRFLEAKGYRSSGWWDIARLARVADPDGKSEVIVFYQEPITVPAGTPPPGDDNGIGANAAEILFKRMGEAVTAE